MQVYKEKAFAKTARGYKTQKAAIFIRLQPFIILYLLWLYLHFIQVKQCDDKDQTLSLPLYFYEWYLLLQVYQASFAGLDTT